MERTKQISPRVAAQVAQRLRLAASLWSRSMSAMVNEALDEKLPSLEEISRQLGGASPEGGGADADVR
jgi:predicted DNA-binding protein